MATARVEAIITAQDRASSVINGVGTSFGKMAGAMAIGNLAAQAAAKALDMVKTAGVGAVKAAASFEQTRVGLENMLGSADEAKNLLSDINKFAAETPFEFPELAQSTRMLVAFGFSAKEAYSGMKTLGDVAAAVGAPMQDLAYLYGTLRAQGRAYTVDIKQFATRGIPIYKYLAKVLGVAETAVAGLVESGTVGFPEVEKAFALMTSKGEQFHGTMAKQAKTLSGLWSTLNDVFGMTARKLIGISDTGDVIEGSIFDRLRVGAQWAINNLPKAISSIQAMMDLFKTGDFKGGIFGQAEDSKFINFLFVAREQAINTFNTIKQVVDFLRPSFVALWNTIYTQLFPTMKRWYEEVIKPLAPIIGVVLVAAIWAAINALNIWYKIVTPIINSMITLANFILVTLPNAVTTGFNIVVAKLVWLKNNFWTAIGFIIGFFLSLPVKIMYAFGQLSFKIIRWVASINWFNVFVGILNGINKIWIAIWDAGWALFSKLRSIPWGDVISGIGKGIANSIMGMIEGGINGALSGIPGSPKVSLPRFANGVQNFGGGTAIVGERGAELVQLPKGSNVIPNHQMGGQASTINITVQAGAFMGSQQDARKFADTILRAMQDNALMKGQTLTEMLGA